VKEAMRVAIIGGYGKGGLTIIQLREFSVNKEPDTIL
jgi:hypothetical protein